MSDFAKTVAAANVEHVTLDGATYRIRKVSSSMLADTGRAFLLVLPTERDLDRAQAREAIREKASDLDPKQQEDTVAHVHAMVCAAVTHAWREGHEPEPLHLVVAEEDGDPAAGRLWVQHLPEHHVNVLFAEAMKLCMGGARAKAIASFREPAPAAGVPGLGGP